MSHIQEIEQRDQARLANNTTSSVSAAGGAVEEAEALPQRSDSSNQQKSSFEQYCDDNPGASQCRVYEE